MYDLKFSTLQQANKSRGALWTKGGPSPGLEFAVIELGGEVGELLNEVKKLLRFRNGMVGGKDNMEAIADELGDVVICCSLLANKLNLDLGTITANKFNKTSDKHGFPIKIGTAGPFGPPIVVGDGEQRQPTVGPLTYEQRYAVTALNNQGDYILPGNEKVA